MPPRTRCLPDTTGLTYEPTETVAACTGPNQAKPESKQGKEEADTNSLTKKLSPGKPTYKGTEVFLTGYITHT